MKKVVVLFFFKFSPDPEIPSWNGKIYFFGFQKYVKLKKRPLGLFSFVFYYIYYIYYIYYYIIPILYHIIPYYTIFYHILPYYTISYHIIPYLPGKFKIYSVNVWRTDWVSEWVSDGVKTRDTYASKNDVNSGHLVPWQRTQAARTKIHS